MIDVLLCGCNGKMGHFIRELLTERQDMQIAAGVDVVKDNTPAKQLVAGGGIPGLYGR